MAKPIITKYNPVELLQSNSVYEPLNGFFFDRLKNFEDLIQYPQKYQNSDTLVLQFQTEAAATFDVKLVSDSNSYNLSTSALIPPISYTGTNLFYKSILALTSVAEGIYYVRVKITTDKIYYFVSEPICIKATHENTILFKYTHDLNQYDTLFQTSTTPNYFYLRVEGGVKTSQFEQGSTDEIFIDQNYNSIQLDGETYNIYNFLFGSGVGLPYWMAEKLNRIMILYEFYIDSKRFKKNQGTKFERIEIIDENYPLCNYKIELLPEQSDVLEIGEGDGDDPPTVTTANVTNVEDTTAECGGEVTSEGDEPVTERGVCWSTSVNPTTANSKTTNGNGLGSFTSDLKGLNDETTYYVRAYATNIVGTSYGSQKTFTTEKTLPAVDTWFFEHVRSTGNLDVKIFIATKDSEGAASFTVDWGDDDTDTVSIATETSGGTEISHTYTSSGNYLVALIGTEANHNKISIIDNLVAERNEMTKFYGNEKWINLKYLKVRGLDETNTGMQLTSITTKSTWTNLQFLWLHNNKELTGVTIHNTWVLLSMLIVQHLLI